MRRYKSDEGQDQMCKSFAVQQMANNCWATSIIPRKEQKDLETECFNAEDALFRDKKDEVKIQALNSTFESIQK